MALLNETIDFEFLEDNDIIDFQKEQPIFESLEEGSPTEIITISIPKMYWG